MKFLKPCLLKLLKVTIRNEQSSREKKLSKEVEKLKRAALAKAREHEEMLEQVHKTVGELRQTISGLNQILDSREKDIGVLEKERDLLQYDVRGLTSINARLTKWVESIRIAEEQPLSEQDLAAKLKDLEGTPPWLVT